MTTEAQWSHRLLTIVGHSWFSCCFLPIMVNVCRAPVFPHQSSDSISIFSQLLRLQFMVNVLFRAYVMPSFSSSEISYIYFFCIVLHLKKIYKTLPIIMSQTATCRVDVYIHSWYLKCLPLMFGVATYQYCRCFRQFYSLDSVECVDTVGTQGAGGKMAPSPCVGICWYESYASHVWHYILLVCTCPVRNSLTSLPVDWGGALPLQVIVPINTQ